MSNADIHGYNTPDRTLYFIRHTVALYPRRRRVMLLSFLVSLFSELRYFPVAGQPNQSERVEFNLARLRFDDHLVWDQPRPFANQLIHMDNQRPMVFGKTWGEDRVDSLGRVNGSPHSGHQSLWMHKLGGLEQSGGLHVYKNIKCVYKMGIHAIIYVIWEHFFFFLNLIVVGFSKFKKRIHRILDEIFKKLYISDSVHLNRLKRLKKFSHWMTVKVQKEVNSNSKLCVTTLQVHCEA